MPQTLFSSESLTDRLNNLKLTVRERLLGLNHDQLLATPTDDLVDQFADPVTIECPVLLTDQIELLPVHESEQRMNGFMPGRIITRRVMMTTAVIPYEGDQAVFRMTPPTFTFNPPTVTALNAGAIHIDVETSDRTPEQIRTAIETAYGAVDTWLNWCRNPINAHNAEVRAVLQTAVEERKQQILAAREQQAAIGFPIRPRPGTNALVAPISRRQIRPVRKAVPAPTKFEPEWAMEDAEYEAALKIIREARDAMERSPSVFGELTEEAIRDHLLMALNAAYEGQATGETFNRSGKTDIMIRVDGRHIFIAEAKVWDGPKSVREGLDQLFSYLVWRDTKAAFLVFIRSGNATEVVEKAIAEITSRTNYKRTETDQGDRHRFVMHADGDPNREIKLELIPFVLGESKSKRPVKRGGKSAAGQ